MSFDARFNGIQQLYGVKDFARLRTSHVAIIGLGGVGSWAAEALARSGIGSLTFVDLDDVCVSNVNRQVHALESALGKPKVQVMAERVRAINPECAVHTLDIFFTASTADDILSRHCDVVIDAIDGVSNKALLIASCVQRAIPIVVTGAAGARKDPAHVRVEDLAFTSHDRLLYQVRKKLKNRHNFPRKRKEAYGVPCVYSIESELASTESSCAQGRRSCNNGLGTVSFVTGSFGLFAAAEATKILLAASASSEQDGVLKHAFQKVA